MTEVFNKFRERTKRKQLRHALPETELILWSKLKHSQLDGYKFRRQCSIGRYVVDFYCPTRRLVVELDGDSHFTDEAEAYDRIRNEYMRSLGLKVVRFTNTEVRENLSGVLQKIRESLHLFSPPSKGGGGPPARRTGW